MNSSGTLHEHDQLDEDGTGQGYVHRVPSRREQASAEIHATIGVAILLLVAIGLIRLVPHLGRTAPGSAWQILLVFTVYPVLRVVDALMGRMRRARAPRSRAALRAALALAFTAPLLHLYLSNPMGAFASCLLAAGAGVWLVRNTPEAML